VNTAEGSPNGGIMGECVRTHDWAATPLGPAETWPQSLRTALSIMLNSAFPTYLAWGPELTSFYNDAYIPILGDKPNSLGRPFPEVWSEVWDTIGPITKRAMEGEASYFEDLPLTLMRRGYPEATWFSFSYSPIRDETGGIGGILCTVHETTQRVHVETALREIEARLLSAIDLVGLSPYTWNPVTGALDWDARLKAMWGLPPDAHVDEEVFLSGVHPEDRPRVEAAIARCSDPAGAGVYAIEYRVIGIGDGIERWVSTHGRTTFQHGRPVAFIGAALDITERRRAEAALRESEERFRQFAENSINTLWILNFETMHLEYLSPAFEVVWGELREGALGDPSRWSRFLHPDDLQSARGALDLVRLGEAITEEFRIVRSDGAVRWIRNTFFPIRNAQGQIRRAGGIAQDITRYNGRFVYVVDAEETAHGGLSHLLRDAGYRVRVFSSGKSFLEAAPALAAGCVVLDICRSGADGLVVPRELKARRIGLPVIALGDAKGDVTFVVQVMKAGAVDFLPVPYGSDQLLAAVASAEAGTHEEDEQNQEADRARLRIAEMSEREREVLAGLLAGKTNKAIGRDIGLSPRTIETDRARVMQRLGVQTLSQAVLIATSAGFQSPSPGLNVSEGSGSPET
jgi:PAS domain S-box-containing protein